MRRSGGVGATHKCAKRISNEGKLGLKDITSASLYLLINIMLLFYEC